MTPMAAGYQDQEDADAAAAPRRPASVWKDLDGHQFQSADTRRSRADRGHGAHEGEYKPEKNAGTSKGSVIRRNVTWLDAPKLVAASSMLDRSGAAPPCPTGCDGM